MYFHPKLLKKGSLAWHYVVTGIIALLVFGVLIYIAFESKTDMLDYLQKIKDILS